MSYEEGLRRKDLLGMQQLDVDEIYAILDTARNMKQVMESGNKRTAYLAGKSVVTLFYENSTRTRASFDFSAKYLGASAGALSSTGSSSAKGESLLDTAITIDRMATDFLILRHQVSGSPHYLAPRVRASVINAGDGCNEHPTQALLDLYTMRDKLGRLDGLRVAIIGDISHSRVARSNLWALQKLGCDVRFAGPGTMMPRFIEQTGATRCRRVEEAAEGADVVMGLRIQLERQTAGLFPSVPEYVRYYSITEEVLAHAAPHALIMHPGPTNHGVEMETSIVEHERSVIHEQVTNGVAVRMAVLYLLNLARNRRQRGALSA